MKVYVVLDNIMGSEPRVFQVSKKQKSFVKKKKKAT